MSCAARVRDGSPFSLWVADDTALCTEAHEDAYVLLCSAFACGDGLELELDMDGQAWDIQHRRRFEGAYQQPDPLPSERRIHFRRCDVDEYMLEQYMGRPSRREPGQQDAG